MIRVLIVEDSDTTRALLAAILEQDSTIQIVGQARNGAEAIAMANELKPDLITMDLSMPVVDGFTATEQIMAARPVPIVVVSSFPNLAEAEAAAHALRSGALTVLQKPPGVSAPTYAESARNLIETVKAMAEVKVVRRVSSARTKIASSLAVRRYNNRPRLLAIAASIGGPQALQTLLSGLGRDFPIPILIVQHITKGFIEGFVRWLTTNLSLAIKLAEPTEPLSPGLVYFAPDDCHLGVDSELRAILSAAPPIRGFRPSANFLFASAAQAVGGQTVAAILTGMGDDGLEGLRAVKQQNGYVIAQDEETSVVFGMPGAAVREGVVDVVLPLGAIAQKLRQLADIKSPSQL
jgi:two-component system, chemotaxis family, protein-glutamate methylesterase/glutaminase